MSMSRAVRNLDLGVYDSFPFQGLEFQAMGASFIFSPIFNKKSINPIYRGLRELYGLDT